MRKRWFFWLHGLAHPWRYLFSEETMALLLVLVVFTMPASAVTRFQERSLVIGTSAAGATTTYTVNLTYVSPEAVGSLDLLFCDNPIPYLPCVIPPGLNVAGATLTSQSGETGFSISTKTQNHIVISRTPQMITSGVKSSYTFTGVVNPGYTGDAFSIRLASYGSTDASGTQIDIGSVRSEITPGVTIQTQVPPMLIFCSARIVYENCAGTDETFYSDLGELQPNKTLTTESQMAVGTNASGGFAITATGSLLAAGTSVIASPSIPTLSTPGQNQFGINLVANTDPNVGSDPDGIWANAMAAPGYDQANHYKYVSGDVIAYSPNVSLMKKFTISYIVNSSADLRAGVYTTTINYIASGRF